MMGHVQNSVNTLMKIWDAVEKSKYRALSWKMLSSGWIDDMVSILHVQY